MQYFLKSLSLNLTSQCKLLNSNQQNEDEKIVLVPKKLVTKTGVIPLSKDGQRILKSAKAKMDKIKQNIVHSKGLTEQEIAIAVKVGLIDKDQTWWWTEEWQKGEREAQKETNAGKFLGPFSSVEQFKTAIGS
jgi:hypothetical protein